MAKDNSLGAILFLVGVAIAVLLGLGMFALPEWMPVALVIGGFLVGFLNVTKKESLALVVATVGVATFAGVTAGIPAIGATVSAIMSNILAFAGPVALVVALGLWWDKAKS